MDNNETPINIFLDLWKGFDNLDNGIVLIKLNHYDIEGTALNHKLVFSDVMYTRTDVPQCSILLIIYQRPATS